MPHSDSPSFDDRVNEAIAAFYEAADRGEALDSETFLAEHADIEQELRLFFANDLHFQQIVGRRRQN